MTVYRLPEGMLPTKSHIDGMIAPVLGVRQAAVLQNGPFTYRAAGIERAADCGWLGGIASPDSLNRNVYQSQRWRCLARRE